MSRMPLPRRDTADVAFDKDIASGAAVDADQPRSAASRRASVVFPLAGNSETTTSTVERDINRSDLMDESM